MRKPVHKRARCCFIIPFVGALILAGCGSGASTQGVHRVSAAADAFSSLITHSHDRGNLLKTRVHVMLVPREGPDAARRLVDLYNPQSRGFGRFISAAQYRSMAAPSRWAVGAIDAFLSHEGIHWQWHDGDAWLEVSAPPTTIDRVFGVDVRRYVAPDGTKFVASLRDPVVPLQLRRWIASAGRISSYFPLRRAFVPTSGLTPANLLRVYDIEPLARRSFDGGGQTIVFFETDGFSRDSLTSFADRFHLPPFDVTVHGPSLSSGEETPMDLEVAHAIAPRAKLIVYNYDWEKVQHSDAGGPQAFASWVTHTGQMVAASHKQVISESLGLCDQFFGSSNARALQRVYEQADLMGESVFVSSGDSGAYECLSAADTGTAPSPSYLGVPLPAGTPGVTAVGGTLLSVQSDGSWAGEATWEGPIETDGSGGGLSRYFGQPSWQSAPGVSQQDSVYNAHLQRMVPDVAADADPNSGVLNNASGDFSEGGGTSQAAPIWAAITALINQYLQSKGLHALGFVNPALYSLARTKQAYPPFHDVVLGNNLQYPAGAGYDMATGLGSPDVWNLARDLATYERTGH